VVACCCSAAPTSIARTKRTTPLHTAVLYRRTEIAEYLIDK